MNTAVFKIPHRSRQAIPDLLDLGNYYTHALDDNWLGIAGVNLQSLEGGVKAYARSAFDIRGLIQLGASGTKGPSSVDIRVGLKGRKFHFLHGVYGSASMDTLVASYVIRYSNGQARNINMLYGRNVRNVCEADRSPLTDGEVILLDENKEDKQLQLARYAANNPLPDVEVKSIDFVTKQTDAAPFVVAITLERNDPVYEWFDSVGIGLYNPILPRSPDATPDQVDLSDFYSASLDDDWFHHSSHDLHDVPKGLQYLADTKFDVRGLIVLGGSGSLEITGLALPESVCGIPVGRKGKKIHFLHACGFASPRGTKIGEYVIHYANGIQNSAPIIYGQNIMDWWESDIVTDARVAWIGSHAASRAVGKQTHLIKYSWDNTLPDVPITSIDFISAVENCAPFLVAITVEPERSTRT
jgi:hypothetical protein